MTDFHYFDWTATTPICDQALKEYNSVSKSIFGNPSSEHPLGILAKDKLKEARIITSEILKTSPDNIFFTSGGTESDNIIIQSLLNNPTPGTILSTAIEHSAVLENKRILEKSGWKFITIPCPGGYLSSEKLLEYLDDSVRMVCIMKVNNVTGTILDTVNLIRTIRSFEKTSGRRIHIHCDAVQALGKIEFFPEIEDFDSAAFSAHKFYGPRGVGILYNRNKSISALSKAGGQEKGIRPSTENLPGICATVTALQISTQKIQPNLEKVQTMHNRIENELLNLGYSIISPTSDCNKEFSPYILTFASHLPSQVYLRMLSDKGFCLSAGSACSSNSKGKAESVLSAMNVNPALRQNSIRLSLSPMNTQEEADLLIKAIKEIKNGN